MWRDLKAVAAGNVAGGRRRELTGRGRWSRFEHALAPRLGERFAVTVELIFGQAFGRGPVQTRRQAGATTEIVVPIEHVGRVREST